MTAAQVIDAGPGHIEAWSLAEDLSSRFEAFARYAVIVGRDMATVGIGTSFNHPLGSLVALDEEGDEAPQWVVEAGPYADCGHVASDDDGVARERFEAARQVLREGPLAATRHLRHG